MPINYKYKFKPKGKGYNVWVTKQKHGKSHNASSKSNGILGDMVADVTARAIVGAICPEQKRNHKTYRLCRDPAKVMRQRRNAEAELSKELDLPQNNKFGGDKMDSLDQKIVDNFPGKIVRKDLTAMMKRGANVPTFVLEYLLGMYCSTDDEDAIEAGLSKIRRILSENYVRPDESEKIKSKIRENGEYTVIDKVSARLDEYKDIYVARFTNLEIEPFVLPAEYASEYTKILTGGIWCITRIAYQYENEDYEYDEKKPKRKKRGPEDSPFKILSLKPIQMPNLDLDEFISKRKEFSYEEWRDLLLRSAGYEPDALSEKEKMHFIERMVPLVERNYNYCELGPRGTGKSHIYKEISPYSILMSGGQTSTANLFYNLSAHRVGLVGHWDCVAFDEVAGMHFRDMDAIQILKDYMASGSFARGRDMINADASIVYIGNINDSVESLLKVTHLFNPFPPEFNNDSAFFDRIHYYLPGWETPKMRSELLTNKYGLITDCLAEFCKEMRKYDFSHDFDIHFRLNKDFNKRDEIAVRKTFSGLSKLLFPDENIPKDYAEMLLEYAIEGRRRVRDRQITNKLLFSSGDIRVLKSRNISDDGKNIMDIDGYDSYISYDDAKNLSVYSYLNCDNVYLTPNMTYKPRMIKKPKGCLVNGSLAVLIPKNGIIPTEEQMAFFSTQEYRNFYQIARNFQTRSLNVDACSVFFYGLLRDKTKKSPITEKLDEKENIQITIVDYTK